MVQEEWKDVAQEVRASQARVTGISPQEASCSSQRKGYDKLTAYTAGFTTAQYANFGSVIGFNIIMQ